MRHGETQESGVGERHTQHSILSEKGVKQSSAVAARFAEIPIGAIVSSHLPRAAQTAQAIGVAKNVQVELNELLRERKRLEDLDGSKKDNPQFIELKTLFKKNFDNPEFHHDEEETFYEFKARIEDFLRSLETSDKDQILVVTHSDVVRMIACVVIFGQLLTPQLYTQAKDRLKHKSTGVTIIENDNDTWSFVTWNDHAHLA
ncbi:MAG: hypothetical protein A2802_01420 [Candidatus Woykebacteria bacterium RIFCSPHIGHO2_01_FULL_43_29]|uniref:Phosphoglycerate mutase n=1 Tax=Candidatus Woykebacteria bacterium RIFCSPLOWO2_01_FULL_43_14 TaxID=1802605 RepID=A0A1G1WSY7_9BACT|nr:MAG: hypothetical protein A2802_01420 [Candidatus Woykebacteria bacterium RIFCSPHIGHO2_01_FULL_43_29]OGY30858.1 MAG: hypothetical protein A3A61_04490 [Candidatus Woykebacteria bacterium RIFCSPLOWO2_01_FULL_43_14]